MRKHTVDILLRLSEKEAAHLDRLVDRPKLCGQHKKAAM